MSYRRSSQIDKPTRLVPVPCSRCHGTGRVEPWGTCFRCEGLKHDPTTRGWAFPASWDDTTCADWLTRQEAKSAAARERRQAKKQAEWLAGKAERDAQEAAATAARIEQEQRMWAENVAACPALELFMADPARFPEFCHDIANSAHQRILTDRQRAAFERIVTGARR